MLGRMVKVMVLPSIYQDSAKADSISLLPLVPTNLSLV
jgi:hypothetical protein